MLRLKQSEIKMLKRESSIISCVSDQRALVNQYHLASVVWLTCGQGSVLCRYPVGFCLLFQVSILSLSVLIFTQAHSENYCLAQLSLFLLFHHHIPKGDSGMKHDSSEMETRKGKLHIIQCRSLTASVNMFIEPQHRLMSDIKG